MRIDYETAGSGPTLTPRTPVRVAPTSHVSKESSSDRDSNPVTEADEKGAEHHD